MLKFFTAYRSELLRSPVYLELAMIRPLFVFSLPSISPLVSDTIDRHVTSLVRAGLSAAKAVRAYQTCSTYTLSFAMLEHGSGHGGLDNDFRAGLSSARYPVLSQLANTEGALNKGDRQFQAGMRILVDGISTMIEQEKVAPSARSRTRRVASAQRRTS